MIHGEHHRAAVANVLQSDHFDAPEKDAQREAKECDEEVSHPWDAGAVPRHAA